MLFSHQGIVGYLNTHFECAWESVRPVPRARIDFGDGRVLERTLSGNIATWICTPRGETVHVLPGLSAPAAYLQELMAGYQLAGRGTPASVRAFHQRRLVVRPVAGQAHGLRILAKAIVEQPIKDALDGRAPQPGASVPDLRKRAVEQPIKHALDGDGLQRDRLYNRTVRAPRVSALLAARPLARPEQLTSQVFRDVLDVDLDDPYLGLAPYVLGGEVGRSHHTHR